MKPTRARLLAHLLGLFALTVLLGACAAQRPESPQPTAAPPVAAAPTSAPTAAPSTAPAPTTAPASQSQPATGAKSSSTTRAVPGPAKDGPVRPNTAKALVPLHEIRSGGPPPDGIPPIDKPQFVTPTDANTWLKDQEPVVSVDINGDARAYPLQILMWHEIVNDDVGGIPVTVTFCPLCNTALAFDRRLDGIIYDFGTSGQLYNSDLVMYDRQTHTFWTQVLGKAIVGDLAGAELAPVPAQIVSWAEFRKAFPSGKVLSRDTGFQRDYGRNPYVGYDDINDTPFLFTGVVDGRLAAMERVVLVAIGDVQKAYPFSSLAKQRVVADTVGQTPIVVFHLPGTTSALDRPRIADSRDVGAAAVFSPRLGGRTLTFKPEEGAFKDNETGSTWNILGHATAGPLSGQRLTPITHGNHFWFASAAFYPNIVVWQP